MPQGLGMGFLRRQGPWEKNNQAMHTVAQMLTGSGARRLGAGLSLWVGVGGRSRSRLLRAVESA